MSDQNPQPDDDQGFIDPGAISTVSTTFYPEGCEEVAIIQKAAGLTPFVFLELVQEEGLIGAEITASWVEDYETLIELLETFTEVVRASLAVQEVTADEGDADE